MTKTLRILTLTSVAVLAANVVNAAEFKPYVSLKAGYVESDYEEKHTPSGIKYKEKGLDGYVGAIAGGAAFEVTPFVTLRAELEYAYSSVDKKLSGYRLEVDKHSFVVNGYADLGEQSWVVKPYVGAGLGYGFGKVDYNNGSGTSFDLDGGFTYAGMLGVAYAVNSNWTLDLGAKYSVWDSSFKESGDKYKTSITDTSYLVGARYSF